MYEKQIHFTIRDHLRLTSRGIRSVWELCMLMVWVWPEGEMMRWRLSLCKFLRSQVSVCLCVCVCVWVVVVVVAVVVVIVTWWIDKWTSHTSPETLWDGFPIWNEQYVSGSRCCVQSCILHNPHEEVIISAGRNMQVEFGGRKEVYTLSKLGPYY